MFSILNAHEQLAVLKNFKSAKDLPPNLGGSVVMQFYALMEHYKFDDRELSDDEQKKLMKELEELYATYQRDGDKAIDDATTYADTIWYAQTLGGLVAGAAIVGGLVYMLRR